MRNNFSIAIVLTLGLVVTLLAASQATGDRLQIYLIDVEGGGATLFVAPSGESLLVDTGNGGNAAGRDAGRILAAMDDAGVESIDHLVTTHWHGDHFGGLAELARQVEIGHYIDHGPSVEANPGANEFIETTYAALHNQTTRTIVEPGDTIDLDGIDVTVLAAGKQVLARPLPGQGAMNPLCAEFEPQDEDNGENAQSVGILVEFGTFRALHLGDLTVNTEFELMCPRNPIGAIDLFVVSHHGQPSSNDRVLVHAVRPRVAIMNNGTRKGGQPETMRALFASPGLEDLWALHFSELGGQEYTVPGIFIANTTDEALDAIPVLPRTGGGRGSPPPPHDGNAYWIEVSAARDGAFDVTNLRNGFSKRYD